ncbi:unnamed protein product [Tenebrio molitor]|nr:unnamed protein product [Tenebrio molitor]
MRATQKILMILLYFQISPFNIDTFLHSMKPVLKAMVPLFRRHFRNQKVILYKKKVLHIYKSQFRYSSESVQ